MPGRATFPQWTRNPQSKNGPASFASSDFGSALSSPIESELGSTESESDQDDDYIAELTRQMAHHMLGDDDREKTWSFAGWPQSTAWSELGSGQEEETVMVDKFDKFKIKEEEEIHKYTDKERFSSTSLKTYPGPSSVREPEISPADQFQSKQALIENQIRLYKLKKSEQIVKQQESLYGAKRSTCYKLNDPKLQVKQFQSKGRARGGQFTSHQQQHRTGSEMRAVFLGDTCPRSGSGGGTGVFLP
ncbi:TIP41-LIKE PROTEIN [Salix purpurea]|uniref:TIP41-LIKE PROTEIN n=1 Tax=Salix purpurea TaxID=77065 RepID=A0A9Q0PP89_SALPP|nr:TIP41-LIKE PROTEIN [Salix purpurea]